ncbi:MAG: alpha/beta fold hydrolase, partial [Solirubrobacteraceae bacterium]
AVLGSRHAGSVSLRSDESRDLAGGYSGFDNFRGLGALLAAELTVFTYDRRGRGESADTERYAVAREVEDLAAVIAEAGGSAFVYAFSSGGPPRSTGSSPRSACRAR